MTTLKITYEKPKAINAFNVIDLDTLVMNVAKKFFCESKDQEVTVICNDIDYLISKRFLEMYHFLEDATCKRQFFNKHFSENC